MRQRRQIRFLVLYVRDDTEEKKKRASVGVRVGVG
jgi:hypothetical protein